MKSWEVKTLGEVCEFERGLTYSKSDEVELGGTAVLRATNINLSTNEIDLTEVRYIRQSVNVPAKKYASKGSILICTASGSKAHLGKVALIGDLENWAFGGFMGQITARAGLEPAYLFRLLSSARFREHLDGISSGMNINNLKFSDIAAFPIPLPPLDEQRRIVAILDEAFAGLAVMRQHAEANLKNSRSLFDSHLNAIFSQRGDGWVETTLGDNSYLNIVDGDRGSNYPSSDDFSDQGFCLFMNTKNVRPDGFDFGQTMFISKDKDDALNKGKLQRGDVVMTTRGTIGNIGLYDDSVEFQHVRINSGMLIFRPNINAIRSDYLFEVFRSDLMRAQIRIETTGAAQPQLPIKVLRNICFSAPLQREEQSKIVDRIRNLELQIRPLESLYRQKLAAIDELKQSILHRAFSGALSATDALAA